MGVMAFAALVYRRTSQSVLFLGAGGTRHIPLLLAWHNLCAIKAPAVPDLLWICECNAIVVCIKNKLGTDFRNHTDDCLSNRSLLA